MIFNLKANSSKFIELTADIPILLIDNQKLMVRKKDIKKSESMDCSEKKLTQENFAIDNEKSLTNYLIQSQNVNEDNFELLGNENCNSLNNFIHRKKIFNNKSLSLKRSTNYLRVSDVSLTDDNESEEFLNKIMLTSQMMPINRNAFTLSPKPITLKTEHFDQSSEKNRKSERIQKNRRETKLTEYNSSEEEILESNSKVNDAHNSEVKQKRAYFQNNTNKSRCLTKVDSNIARNKTLFTSDFTNSRDDTNERNLKVFPQIQTNTNHKPMQTLAKFHKTLNK
jgi:hypothetical protein